MKKRLICLFAAMCLTISLFAVNACAVGESGSLKNFKTIAVYHDDFKDVATNAWYYENVKTAYQMNLVAGTSSTTFSPDTNITLAEVITLAARIHNIYYDNNADFLVGNGPWYQGYVDYAIAHGIIQKNADLAYNRAATRTEFAVILGAALPDEALPKINDVETGAIPYVISESIYRLYRAGILIGRDSKGTFDPWEKITRGEAVCIVTRMANTSLRVRISKPLAKPENEENLIYQYDPPNPLPDTVIQLVVTNLDRPPANDIGYLFQFSTTPDFKEENVKCSNLVENPYREGGNKVVFFNVSTDLKSWFYSDQEVLYFRYSFAWTVDGKLYHGAWSDTFYC